MLKGLVFFLLSTVVWIARRSGEQFGYDKAIKEIRSAAKGELLDLQKAIEAKRKKIDEKYQNIQLSKEWPSSGVVDLKSVLPKENSADPSVTTSAEMHLERD